MSWKVLSFWIVSYTSSCEFDATSLSVTCKTDRFVLTRDNTKCPFNQTIQRETSILHQSFNPTSIYIEQCGHDQDLVLWYLENENYEISYDDNCVTMEKVQILNLLFVFTHKKR